MPARLSSLMQAGTLVPAGAGVDVWGRVSPGTGNQTATGLFNQITSMPQYKPCPPVAGQYPNEIPAAHFTDVASPYANDANLFYVDGISAGCGGPDFCPR